MSAHRPATAADREDCLSSGVAALEACAAVWQEFGPVAGQRQVKLLRRLEQTLAREEADIVSGRADYMPRRVSVRIAFSDALEATTRLEQEGSDRAKALDALENAAVSLAAIAVRVALNIEVTGTVGGASAVLPAGITAELLTTADEVARKSRQLGRELRVLRVEPSASIWLSEALLMRLVTPSIAGSDPTLRAESLLSCRSSWLRLGALQMLLLEALDEELATALERRERLGRLLGKSAAKLIRRARLASRPEAFDFARAWQHQQAMLARVVGAYCRGLEGDDEGFEAAWKCIVATLVRVTAALWLIDAQLGHRPVSRLLPEAVARRRPKPPQTHDERLAQVVTAGGSRAVEAALELFERREPASFSDAVKLVSSRGVPGRAAFDAMADAWETYQIVRHQPWD